MTTTELRIAVLLVAIVFTYLLVKLYLHVLRSRVIPAIEPEASDDTATESGGTAPDAAPDEDADDGTVGEAEPGGEDPPRG